ncbi:MAG TPA: hypothetical protein PLO23_01265 [Alphaproteobacteria bacterium]|nr:hypothetical protein [Alphaproteobacteria bacterium]
MAKRRSMCILLATLSLAACGEGSGWEMQLTNTMFPYGNQRTAGSGVAYVRAKMLPEKSISLENVKRDMTPQASPVTPPPATAVEQKLEKALSK